MPILQAATSSRPQFPLHRHSRYQIPEMNAGGSRCSPPSATPAVESSRRQQYIPTMDVALACSDIMKETVSKNVIDDGATTHAQSLQHNRSFGALDLHVRWTAAAVGWLEWSCMRGRTISLARSVQGHWGHCSTAASQSWTLHNVPLRSA